MTQTFCMCVFQKTNKKSKGQMLTITACEIMSGLY